MTTPTPFLNDTPLPRILLHTCCAPCSPHIINLLSENYDITLHFYNPNIHPEEEHTLRLEEIRKFALDQNLPLIESPYELSEWSAAVLGLENEPERGKRCDACFTLRLNRAAQTAAENRIPVFATTLTISPHKNVAQVNVAGTSAAKQHGVQFLESDFKKNDGYKISSGLSRRHNFYRQNYCGCQYSRRPLNLELTPL